MALVFGDVNVKGEVTYLYVMFVNCWLLCKPTE